MPEQNSLLIFRDKINDIDEKIVKLLSKRKILAFKIAKSKIENNKSVRDTEREKKLLQKLINIGKDNYLTAEYITKIFELIIEDSVSTQMELLQEFYYNKKLNFAFFSFLGPKGSYSHIAVCEYAKKKFKTYFMKACSTFEETLCSVENNESDYAILPIENTCSGYIDETLQLLIKTNLFIVGEIKISINHCLLAVKKVQLCEIKTIYSHPQPFKQCSNFIKKFSNWKIKYTKSTADAMKKILQYNDITKAALGSEIGKKIYNLHILHTNLANQKNNTTRFIVLHRKPLENAENQLSKTTLILSIKKKSDTLNNILFMLKNKIISIKKINIKYSVISEDIFYLDIQDNLSSILIKNILKTAQKHCNFIKILGSYPSEI
ncbi:chorismate mutase [Buchnera aphidicola (Hyadaphis tataricae)]|uniref:Bifunctional chorismate mutase/prephenate dehydratase n=1 Tax=Buchnera aphidicola (Hyadaphis tataricae) TaxID=1241859 RepID=A0A4D6XYU1_9GAMM|nr:chorismate mutase [Buchnera aphidicola]QCI21683.1 chorismate mutase [Buchnera aphidicola (Hyadaphis tataricae)]